MYRRLLPYLRPHAWRMGATMLCNIVAALLDAFSLALLIPFLNILFDQPPISLKAGWVSDLLNATVGALLDPADKMGSLRQVILLVVAAMLVKNLLVWVSASLGATLQEYVTRDLRNALYRHLVKLPLGYFTRMKSGQILSRVINDTSETRLVLTHLMTHSLQSVAMIAAYVAFLIGISWKLTLIALFVAPILIGAMQPMLRKLRKGARRRGNVHGEMTSVVQETVGGIRLVKSFGAEAYEEGRFYDASGKYAASTIKLTRLAYLAPPLAEVVGTIMALFLLWIGAQEVLLHRTMSGADLIAFLMYVLRLLHPLKQLSQAPTIAQSSLASAERLFDVLDAPAETQLDKGTVTAARFERQVAFENVSFAYDGEPVLQNVSFAAPKGFVVALVGPSGAGKTTMVDLIPRFYQPDRGRITIDGVDTREIRLDALRSLMGIVGQDTILFNDTVRSNIAYGAPGKFSPERIEEAGRAANAHEFISELPEGYETLLGERGTRLSGGQRQRIAIARALLHDPPILILDEATSALDTESERLVQEAIERLLAGRTVFVIAHRLSTIVHADIILVLDRGVVVERGTHTELMAKQSVYNRLYSLQFREPEVVGSGAGV
ncbi:MAG: ABC transporter ATP-binding protein [Gemmatimonadaceae bacterium]